MFENETNRSVVTGYKAVTIIRQIKSDDITPYCIGYVEVGIDVQQLENKLQQDFRAACLFYMMRKQAVLWAQQFLS